MKRYILGILFATLFFGCSSQSDAEIKENRFAICKDPKTMDIEIGVVSGVKVLKEEEIAGNANVYSMYALQMKNTMGQTGEIRFSLFTDTKPFGNLENDAVLSDIKMSVLPWFLNAFGEIPDFNNLKALSEASARNFNADAVWYTSIVSNNKTEFDKNFSNCIVQIFYRKNQGLVIRTTLYPADYIASSQMDYFHNLVNFKFLPVFDK